MTIFWLFLIKNLPPDHGKRIITYFSIFYHFYLQCVFKVTEDGLVLKELGPGCTIPEIQTSTGCQFFTADDLTEMRQIDDEEE